MKIRNKKTGEIVDFGSPAFIIDNTKNSVSMRIKNLAELNEEWKDYAPKEPLIKGKKAKKAEREVGDIIGVVRYSGEYKPIYNFDDFFEDKE